MRVLVAGDRGSIGTAQQLSYVRGWGGRLAVPIPRCTVF